MARSVRVMDLIALKMKIKQFHYTYIQAQVKVARFHLQNAKSEASTYGKPRSVQTNKPEKRT